MEGTENGQFEMPWDVAVDSGNNVFVPDYGNNRIFKFSPTTIPYLRDWGTEGKGAGEFNHPAVIAFDNAENLYVTDSENQ